VNSIGEIKGKHILFLQGPVGFFFKKLDKQFRLKGATTYRIGLNAGDEFFSYKDNYTSYGDTPDNWAEFIRSYLREKKIEMVFLFGDCRFYQNILVNISNEMNLEIFVFEEGYIRPNYITMERFGVNNYSRISRERAFYEKIKLKKIPEAKDTKPNPVVNWAIVITYYFVAKLFHFKYLYYHHHRNYSAIEEFFYGVRSLLRKIYYTQRDKKYIPLIEGKFSKNYFFVPLQTHNDFQILQHSNYGSIETFIHEVLTSFASNADASVMLMFKHHPIDRGRKNYTKMICTEAKKLGIEKRVLVVHDLHLPTCLKNTLGTVTINSTVGLSSLYHGSPTIALGNAIYDIEGLTNKGKKLNKFWTNPLAPDVTLVKKFRQYLIENTQLNGSFYGCKDAPEIALGCKE